MIMKRLLFSILLLTVFALAADSPFDGTWKVDLNSAQLPDKPTVIVLQKGTYQNNTSIPKIDIKADGTDQRVPGATGYDTLAVKVLDDKTVEFIAKRGGKVVSSERVTASADGKTSTSEFTDYPMASKQPVTGKVTQVRLEAGPSGSHAISGTWHIQKLADISENALTASFKSTSDGLMYSTSTGEAWDAKFDGKDYPVKGALAGSTVALTKVNDRSIIATTKRDGKIVSVSHMTIAHDGKSMSMKEENKVQGVSYAFTSIKQ
jgi:hypothetical protein